MDNQIPVPYRTPTGLQIGKFYTPPKERDIRVDLIDMHDQDRIQTAYITNGAEMRKEKISLIAFFALAAAFVSLLVIFA